ncbi:hypothetical protein ITR00_07190 [Pediococcus pentosaceus]|uniref:hypothetical protein n=1 Tax=Pediococcus pentosaceus TaxID=1255 RepID=UPI00190AC601|nr:hypothetical protein [Pediococcus pentosaceus]MBF7125819.1 hypothetical protein [Pediococcus pentosaceus]WPK15824.1 hypothetical protein R6U75_05145 [Pediococcus pentosaceus]
MSSIGQGSVSIDDSTRIGENAQDTANEVAGNVNDINSDNKLTPSEKLKLKQEYDKDVELYNIDIEQLKSVDLPTAELKTAMSNLTDFVTPLFKEMNRTLTVDIDTLDSVFTAFATADKNASQAFVNMVQQVADDAKKAGDDAKEAGAKAQKAGEEAKASADQAKADATQAKADAAVAQQKAQSSIDQFNAHLPDIDEALSTANLVKQNVTKLSDTTEQYHNEYTTGIQNIVKTIDGITIGGTNLIKNSKFDDNGINWRAWGGSEGATVEYNTPGADWDSRVKKLVKISKPNADNNQFGIAQDSIPVEPGAEYVFHVRNANSNIFLQHGNGTDDPWEGVTLSGSNPTYKFKVGKETRSTNIYLGFDHGQSGTVWVSLTKLEKGNKPTDWSLSPFDTATSTEIDQINNAIRLKADSSDVTSQINVAVKGVQSEVDNKVSDLNTKISQTSDAVQILNTTSGLRNLVYNSSYTNNAEGWNMFNQNGYLSTLAVSSYNGSPGFGVSVSGKGASTWTKFGESKRYTLPQPDAVATENTYSGSAMIKMYDDSDSTAHLSATLAYYDKNGARIGWKDMLVFYDSKNVWTKVKFENFPVPKGAYSIGMQYWAYGPKVHGMIAQPMIVFGPKIGPYNPDAVSQSDITASINNIHLGVKNADGSTSTFNMNDNTILMDTAQTIINGKTSILDASIDTAKITNAAINTAQIADGAINNAKIANASIDDAKINSLNGNKLVENSITANKIDVNDLIANGINTKTLTSVNLNTSTLTTPKLNLGMNGTFTEDFDYTQPTSLFLPKKNKGTLTFNHGVIQSEGRMQTYVNGQWGGMNDSLVFQSGIDNAQWTEVAPGYLKMDLYKQDGTTVAERTYSDPTGFYYTSMLGNKSYLGNILQTSQVQTPSVLAKYIGPSDGELRLQIGNNGSHYGFQVGSYAGKEAVLSDFIYSATSSHSPDVHITENGHLVRTTSASKYKYNIENPDIETTLGDRLLNVRLATWNDKRAVDLYAEQLSTGEGREKTSIDKYYGLIAEQLRDAGLDMFISYGKNHKIEGIQYDRAWIPLLSVIRRLNNKVNEYELRLSKLEGVNK